MQYNMITSPDDPDRCQGSYASGQCRHKVEPGDKYCKGCGGQNLLAAQSKRLYMLKDVEKQRRLAEFSDHSEIKSLREEIAILRMIIEKRMNSIESDTDLIMASPAIDKMINSVEKLVKTAHATEQSLNVLLSRNTVLTLAQRLCEIVIDEVQYIDGYELIIDNLSKRLIDEVMGVASPTPVTNQNTTFERGEDYPRLDQITDDEED